MDILFVVVGDDLCLTALRVTFPAAPFVAKLSRGSECCLRLMTVQILLCRQSGDIKEYFVKWKDLGYDELSWELDEDITPFQAEIAKYNALLQKGASKALMKRKIAAGLEVKEAKRRRKEIKAFKKTPKFLVGGTGHHGGNNSWCKCSM